MYADAADQLTQLMAHQYTLNLARKSYRLKRRRIRKLVCRVCVCCVFACTHRKRCVNMYSMDIPHSP